MTTRQEALSFGMTFKDVYQDTPFHDPNWILVRYKKNKKAFLWTYEYEGQMRINIKVDPQWRDFWREAYAAVIPKFIKQLMDGETPTINGDGRQSRDFTYVENVVEANLKACQASSEAAGEAFNIGAGGREFLIDVYHNICKALNKEVEPNFGPDRKGDIRDSNADISKARKLLGYDPDYDFARGIALAIDWYKENL